MLLIADPAVLRGRRRSATSWWSRRAANSCSRTLSQGGTASDPFPGPGRTDGELAAFTGGAQCGPGRHRPGLPEAAAEGVFERR
ncbi:hypothetical protein ACU686_01915 [Yinghuangia aomiensis]